MNGPVAALFVETGGVYANLPGVEVWDEARDARLYEGPFPVVAHPPCARWCQLASVNEARWGARVGDDGGCFEAALSSVRRFGGVLEHPAYTLAWAHHGLPKPRRGSWQRSLWDDGWVTEVSQVAYGCPARKRTWLYLVGEPVPLDWSEPEAFGVIGGGIHSGQSQGRPKIEDDASSATPPAFRDLLLELARSAQACPECHGEGRMTVAGYSTSPFSGVLVNDPQEAHDEPCDACAGTGLRASRRSLASAQTQVKS